MFNASLNAVRIFQFVGGLRSFPVYNAKVERLSLVVIELRGSIKNDDYVKGILITF
jgi:hypothetical protein